MRDLNDRKHTLRRIIITITVWLAAAVVFYAAAAAAVYFFLADGIIVAVTNKYTYIIWGCAMACILIWLICDYRVRASKRVKKVNADLEDSHFMTRSEMKHADGFTVTDLNGLAGVKDGIPLSGELNKKKSDMRIVLRNPIHTLVIGATGSGKTQTFVSPFLEINSRTKTKPSFVVTDPKGELYRKHSEGMRGRGYKVECIDLADIYHSTRWNPFNDILHKTAIVRCGITQRKGKYYFDEKEYLTESEASKAAAERSKELNDEIYSDLQDMIYTAFPVDKDANQKFWQDGARNFIFAITLAFWEDVRDGLMDESQFTLYNVWRTVSDYATGDMKELKAYFSTRSPESRTRGLANTVLVAEDVTLSSFLSNVNQYVIWLADQGIAALTSGNEIEFSEMDEQPTVLFIRIPDEKENRHILVSIMLVQLYKALVGKAKLNLKQGRVGKEEELLRHVYFLMDEFGNLPKLEKMDSIVTVGRSRGIYMVPVIQDYNQLDNKYGKSVSAVVRGNCNIKIFIGCSDKNTIDEFSALCGKKKVRQVSYSESNNMSVSTSASSVPLIYPSELASLNDPANGKIGNAVILSDGVPILTKTSPFYLSKTLFCARDGDVIARDFVDFDEAAVHYDVVRTAAYLGAGMDDGEEAEEQPFDVMEDEKSDTDLEIERRVKEDALRRATFSKYLKMLSRLKGKIPELTYEELERETEPTLIIAILGQAAEEKKKEGKDIIANDIYKLKDYVLCVMVKSDKHSEVLAESEALRA